MLAWRPVNERRLRRSCVRRQRRELICRQPVARKKKFRILRVFKFIVEVVCFHSATSPQSETDLPARGRFAPLARPRQAGWLGISVSPRGLS